MKKQALYNSGAAKVSRIERLTVRLTAEDREKLEQLRELLSPHTPVSLGKAASAAIQMAWQSLVVKDGGKKGELSGPKKA